MAAVGFGIAVGTVYVFELNAYPADAWTYLAAGERLNDGHRLYALVGGDRPLPPEVLGHGPWPLLSPPLIAVPWRALALLPSTTAVFLWWVVMAMAIAATLALLSRRPAAAALVAAGLGIPLMFQVVSANVNALIILGGLVAWLLWRRGSVRAAGALIGAMIVLKIIAVPLAVWLLVKDRADAGRGLAAGIAAGTALAVLGTGVESHLDYLGVIAGASAAASPMSLAGFGALLGLPASWALPTVIQAGSVLAIFRFEHRPAIGFQLAIIAMVFGYSAVHIHTMAILVLLAAPLAWPVEQPMGAGGVPADRG